MDYHLIIDPGTHIFDAAKEACEVAREERRTVDFVFNGIRLVAFFWSHPEEIVKEYFHELKKSKENLHDPKLENPSLVAIELNKESKSYFYKDRIIISLPPVWVEALAAKYSEGLPTLDDYKSKGIYGEKADFFNKVLKEWKERRRINEKGNI